MDVWGIIDDPELEVSAPVSARSAESIVSKKILVTGSAGFIGGYLVEELLGPGYEVVGLDNFSKYGRVEKSYDSHPRYHFVEGDAKDVELLKELLADCDHFVAGAAMIGGICYFHEYAYDLLAENERITAATFDAAIEAHREQPAAEDHGPQLDHGVRERDGVPDARGRRAQLAAAAQHLRLPEARLRVLRAGRARAVRAALHHRAAVQLRRHRRAARARRQGRAARATSSWR